MEDFLYRSSHDLRGPLATIQGLVNISLLPNTASQDQQKYLQEIKRFADTLDQSLRNIQTITDKDLVDTMYSNVSNVDQYSQHILKSFHKSALCTDCKLVINLDDYNAKIYFPFSLVLKFIDHLFNYLENMGKSSDKREIKIKIHSDHHTNIIKISTKGFELSELHKEMLQQNICRVRLYSKTNRSPAPTLPKNLPPCSIVRV